MIGTEGGIVDTTAGTSRPLGLVVDDEPQMRYVITFALETQASGA